MSKTRRRPANHGKHRDPAEIRRHDPAEIRRHDDPAEEAAPVSAPAPAPAPAPAEPPPLTTAGDYLRRVAADDAPARFGTPSGPVDDYARRVWQTAFGLAVRRRFEPDSPLAEISRSAAAAAHAHEAAGLPAIDIEMVVRAELGEQVPVDELDPAELIGVHLLVFASLVDELALGDRELDDLITQAEQAALAAVGT